MNLSQLIGNESIKRSLSGQETPPHAVILSGPKGSGRHTLAMLLKQAYLCTGETVPCGTCANCRKVKEGIHPDVMDLTAFLPEGEEEKEVRVGTIRDIRADAQIRPNQSRRKVYLIDRPMNGNAQNAMLKLLEEGPPYAAFLLLTENSSSLLETVRSRCAQFQLSPPTEAEAMVWLERKYPDCSRDQLYRAVKSGGGLLGRAAELLEAEGKEDETAPLVDNWLRALINRSELKLMECAAAVQTGKLSRDAAAKLYAAMGRRFRDGAVCAVGLQPENQQAAALAKSFSSEQLLSFHELTEQAGEMCSSNVAPAHSAGWLAVKLWGKCAVKNTY